MERWKAIADFPDYEISDLGNVRRVVPDRHGRISNKNLAPILGSHGYMVVSLHRNARQYVRMVHRLVCEAFNGAPPTPKHHAAHCDGNRSRNWASNLRWATPSENNMDKHSHGTMKIGEMHHAIANPECMPRGEGHGNAKLTEGAVRAIRTDTRPQRLIAADYGVAQSLVSQVKLRKIWAHIQ